jgi:uracil-DNA glycosylase family 4
MFVGEGPGADEDASGVPFVGKAGQLLNNMIAAMGLKREEVYIANIVKCRPPANRTPEFIEATTCSQFLVKQIDIVRPEVIVALGATAATYLLGVKQSLASLRGQWHSVRGAKVAVTYHPAFPAAGSSPKGRGVEGSAASDGRDASGCSKASVLISLGAHARPNGIRLGSPAIPC